MATIEPQLKLPENVTMYIWAEKLFAKVYTIYRLPCSDTRLIRARTDHSPNAIGARQGTLGPDNGSQASEARTSSKHCGQTRPLDAPFYGSLPHSFS